MTHCQKSKLHSQYPYSLDFGFSMGPQNKPSSAEKAFLAIPSWLQTTSEVTFACGSRSREIYRSGGAGWKQKVERCLCLQTAVTRYYRLHINKDTLLLSPGGWKPMIRVSLRPGSREGSLLLTYFSLCPHTAQEVGTLWLL